MNYNKVILGGHLTRDPETKTLPGGTVICNFGIAVNQKRGDKEEAMFVDCAAFNKTAETIQKYCTKGAALLVEGRLRLEQWTDKENNKRSKHSITVDSFAFAGGKSGGSNGKAAEQAAPAAADGVPTGDGIPF